MKFSGNKSYLDVVETLREEYQIDKTSSCKLFTATQEAVSPDINVKDFYEASQARYVGATRIYLAVYPGWLDGDINKDEVKYYILQDLEHQNAEEEEGASIAPDNFIPYQDGVKVRLFIHMLNKVYSTTTTRWGVFCLLPQEDDAEFQSFTYSGIRNCYIMTPPLKYYLNKELTMDNIEVNPIGKDVWKLPQYISEEYDKWLETMYESLRDGAQ